MFRTVCGVYIYIHDYLCTYSIFIHYMVCTLIYEQYTYMLFFLLTPFRSTWLGVVVLVSHSKANIGWTSPSMSRLQLFFTSQVWKNG